MAKKDKKLAAKSEASRTQVDLDELVKEAKTYAVATDYQAYLRNKLKGISE